MRKARKVVYRSKDFSTVYSIETEDIFDVEDCIEIDGVNLVRVPNTVGPGHQFIDYVDPDGNILSEIVELKTAPDEFVRDGVHYARKFTTPRRVYSQMFYGSEKPSGEIKEKLQEIKKKLPRRKRHSVGDGIVNF